MKMYRVDELPKNIRTYRDLPNESIVIYVDSEENPTYYWLYKNNKWYSKRKWENSWTLQGDDQEGMDNNLDNEDRYILPHGYQTPLWKVLNGEEI